jgi:hypothetical protein
MFTDPGSTTAHSSRPRRASDSIAAKRSSAASILGEKGIVGSFDDARVQVGVVALPAARLVVGVRVHDRRAFARAGNALGDDVLDAGGNARLAFFSPRTVQRHFEPGLGHASAL